MNSGREGYLTLGKMYTLEEDVKSLSVNTDDIVSLVGHMDGYWANRFKFPTIVEKPRELSKEDFSVGAQVEIIGNINGHCFKVGHIGFVTKISGTTCVVDGKNTDGNVRFVDMKLTGKTLSLDSTDLKGNFFGDITSRLEVNDKVYLREDSRWFNVLAGEYSNNPQNMIGTVTDVAQRPETDYSVKVQWSNGRLNTYRRVDLNKVNPAVTGLVRKGTQKLTIECVQEKSKITVTGYSIDLTKPEESKMAQVERKVVNVQLIDQDAGLPVEHSLVHDFGAILTEDSHSTTIQQLIVEHPVAQFITEHNAVRAKQVNLDILNRTGNEVFLQPVKLKDLTWKIQ